MSKGRLLIVDDEKALLEMLETVLMDCADEIYIVENGKVALEKMQSLKFHCVICDINMPKMNGVEFLKQVRAQKNDVPFIFYTGYGNHELMVKALKYGAFDFLDKPNLDGLEEIVMRGLNKGLNKDSKEPEHEVCFVSEYKKMLENLDKKGD